MRPSIPSSTPATTTEATALSHSPAMPKRTPVRPKHSASTVTALGISARIGMTRPKRLPGNFVDVTALAGSGSAGAIGSGRCRSLRACPA